MSTTANYGLTKPGLTGNADITVIDANMDIIDGELKKHDTSMSESTNILTPITNSTANAILLNILTFTNNRKYSFKANANSTGSVTINGKALKKPDGTQIGSGGIKSVKVYDFYYDSASDSVFILAKAEGDVTAADVLAGKIYSSGDEVGAVGIMPNITTDQTAGTISQSGTTVSLLVPKGYWDGTKKLNAAATAIDADIVSGNIKSGSNICGVAGAANVVDTTISSNAAIAANIRAGYKCYSNGALITGTAPEKSATTITPGTADQTVASGTFLTGLLTILGDSDLLAANIVSGKSIFEVAGSATASSLVKKVTGTSTIQVFNNYCYIDISNCGINPNILIFSASCNYRGYYNNTDGFLYLRDGYCNYTLYGSTFTNGAGLFGHGATTDTPGCANGTLKSYPNVQLKDLKSILVNGLNESVVNGTVTWTAYQI